MPRPHKYGTEEQRVAAKRAQKLASATKRPKRVSGRYFRLVVPALGGYPPTWTWQTPEIVALRARVVDLLTAKQRRRGLQSYLVAVERHPGSGLPHLDVLLVYSRRVQHTLGHYDYIVKHGNLTRYRTVNAAILEYGRKEDPSPLGTLDVRITIDKYRAKKELYVMMRDAMMCNPFEFNPWIWLRDNKLDGVAAKTTVFKTIKLVEIFQNIECNRLLAKRPGIRQITPELIRERLTPEELQTYHSWPGYAEIVDHVNQIPRWGCRRPHKTRNLLIVGRPGTGKTAFAMALEQYCPTYPLGTPGGWFPAFRSGTYKMLVWDEFNLGCYKYPDLLKLLEGRPMKLPQKGGHVERADNQLIYMTSNLPLESHISKRFYSEEDRVISLANLSERITVVHVPENLNLFLLQKLITRL